MSRDNLGLYEVEMEAEIKRLRALTKELVAALKEYVEFTEMGGWDDNDITEKARAALAKAKG